MSDYQDTTSFSDVPVETRFYAVANSAPDAIISANGQGNIIFWNKSATRIFGYYAEDVIGKSLTIIIPEKFRDAHTRGMQRLQETGKANVIGRIVELEGQHKDGHTFPIELSLSMWQDEHGERFFNGIIRDITQRKEAERMQQDYAQRLEERNQELYAYDRTIAHDLKNPLTIVTTYAHLLQMQHESILPQKSKEQLERILHASKTMADMMDQLLFLATLRDSSSVVEAVDTHSALTSVVDRYADELDMANLTLHTSDTLPHVMAQNVWLEQIFGNLIGNAIKYRAKENTNSWIKIRGYAVGKMARFEVEDNGLGIPDEAQKRLFEAFSRAHADQAAGFGVGLSIVHRIVQRLGGEIGVASKIGEGSTFWFELPLASDN